MEIEELLATAGRGVAVYALMLVVIRLLGKRTVGNFTAFDLLVALMLGEVVDEIIYGDVTFAQGTTAIVVVAAAKYLTSLLAYSNRTASTILEGKPTVILEHGEIDRRALRSEVMSELDLFAALRMQGVDDMRKVRKAVLEEDGSVSVILEEWAEPVEKRDVKGSVEQRQAPEDDEPPEEKKTDTPRALGLET